MDLQLKSEKDEEEVQIQDEYGIDWTLVVLPCLPSESNKMMKQAGLACLEESQRLSPEANKWAELVALKHTKRIVKVEKEGEAVTINGEHAAAANVADLLVRHDTLARLITFRCLALGGAVVEQRGN